jgi:hypothetical protein
MESRPLVLGHGTVAPPRTPMCLHRTEPDPPRGGRECSECGRARVRCLTGEPSRYGSSSAAPRSWTSSWRSGTVPTRLGRSPEGGAVVVQFRVPRPGHIPEQTVARQSDGEEA